jgi:hypothetical protein
MPISQDVINALRADVLPFDGLHLLLLHLFKFIRWIPFNFIYILRALKRVAGLKRRVTCDWITALFIVSLCGNVLL